MNHYQIFEMKVDLNQKIFLSFFSVIIGNWEWIWMKVVGLTAKGVVKLDDAFTFLPLDVF